MSLRNLITAKYLLHFGVRVEIFSDIRDEKTNL